MKKNILCAITLILGLALSMNNCKKPDELVFENETFTAKSVSFEMIAVKGGTFTMGQAGGITDYGPKTATLSNFIIGKTEVTQELWLAVMGAWPGTAPSAAYGVGNNHPAYFVSWYDIVGTFPNEVAYTVNGVTYYKNGFCYKLSYLAGSGRKFILPTAAQWEYAARGGSGAGTLYAGTNTDSSLGNYAWYKSNSDDTSHPVAKKQPNALGIYDMSGNVWEWCSDCYGANEGGTNPIGPAFSDLRVLRGGSWYGTGQNYCRVTWRFATALETRHSSYGFRLSLVP